MSQSLHIQLTIGRVIALVTFQGAMTLEHVRNSGMSNYEPRRDVTSHFLREHSYRSYATSPVLDPERYYLPGVSCKYVSVMAYLFHITRQTEQAASHTTSDYQTSICPDSGPTTCPHPFACLIVDAHTVERRGVWLSAELVRGYPEPRTLPTWYICSLFDIPFSTVLNSVSTPRNTRM